MGNASEAYPSTPYTFPGLTRRRVTQFRATRHAFPGLTRRRAMQFRATRHAFRAWRVDASCNSGRRVMLFWAWRVEAPCFSGPDASTRHAIPGDASCFSGPFLDYSFITIGSETIANLFLSKQKTVKFSKIVVFLQLLSNNYCSLNDNEIGLGKTKKN